MKLCLLLRWPGGFFVDEFLAANLGFSVVVDRFLSQRNHIPVHSRWRVKVVTIGDCHLSSNLRHMLLHVVLLVKDT